jgi:hypothetical protein
MAKDNFGKKDRFGVDWSGREGSYFLRRPHLGRRMFFRHMASAIGGYVLLPGRPGQTIARAAGSPISTAKSCIFVNMTGGPAHTETFDLKVGAWTPAALNPGRVGDILWPQGAMPRLAEQLDSVALLRSVRSWTGVHGLGQTWVQIGRNPIASTSKIAPHIGSVVALELGPQQPDRTLPAFIALNAGNAPGSGYLAPEHGPFHVNPGGNGLGNTIHRDGPAVFDRRYDTLQKIDAEERALTTLGVSTSEMVNWNLSARKLMYNSDVDRAFTVPADERLRYGNSGFGNACAVAKRLVTSGLGTRFVQVNIGGWDNHSNIYGGPFNVNNANSLIRQFDAGLAALIADLKASGALDETLVIAMGEFGRTVGPLNAQGGRDHFLQQAVLMAGARIRGGRAIGSTDEVGRATVEPGWARERDIRAEDIEASIYSALGIDWTTIRRDDPIGRGFYYVPESDRDTYGPINELWS